MLSVPELSDRLEIQDLLARYCDAIDRGDWEALDRVFTADAVIDYSAMGGSVGGLAATKAFLAESMPLFSSYQHLIGSTVVDLDGDTARARSICHNPMVIAGDDVDDARAEPEMLVCGLWYRDELVRTGEGWRIRSRVEERGYMRHLRGPVPQGPNVDPRKER